MQILIVRVLFSILFGTLVLLAISVLVSLVPLNFVGNSVLTHAKKNKIEIVSQTSWNLRLLGLKANSGKITYRLNLDDYEISGYGEDFTFGLTNQEMHFDNLIVDLLVEKEEEIEKFFEKITEKIKNKEFSLSVVNLTINIYTKNEDGKKDVIEEILFNNFEITKTKDITTYKTSLNTNKNDVVDFLLKKRNIGQKNYEINGKLEGKNVECFLYSNNKTGEFSCKTGNFLKLLNEFGFNIKDDDLKKNLRKNIKIVANTSKKTDQEKPSLKGSVIFNGAVGQMYTDENNTITLKFKDVNFDDTVKDDEDNIAEDEEEKKQKKEEWHKLAMSGNENKFIEEAKKKNIQENINFASKMIKTFYKVIDNLDFRLKTEIDTATINSQHLKNITISVAKPKGSNISFAGTQIYYTNSLDVIDVKNFDEENDIFTFAGENIVNLFALFNSQIINKDLTTSSYNINGKLALKTNGFEFKDTDFIIDERKIATINLSQYHNSLNKIVSIKKNLAVQNVNINEIFDLKPLYKKYYDEFNIFQQKEEQEPIFWQKLFEKRKQKSSNIKYNNRIILDNILLENIKIDNFVYELSDNNKNTELNININSTLSKGTLNFAIKNIDGKETVSGDAKIKSIDSRYLDTLNNSIKNATGKNFKEIFFEDKEYNIPSFLGINGNFGLNIDSLNFPQNTIIQNISGNIAIKDGVFETNDFIAEYGNGKINGNIIFSLRGRPQLSTGFIFSGMDIKKIIPSKVDGLLSIQAELSSNGFNYVDFTKNCNGKGKFVINNLNIPNFNLQAIGVDSIKNGINKNINYEELAGKNNLKFPQADGKFIIENGIINANIAATTEMVSGNANFEYIPSMQTIKKLSGIFAVIISRNKLESPMQIYIPYACNENIINPSCIVDWGQLNEVIKSTN